MPTKKGYTLTEAANELGLTRGAVHKAIKTGRLKALRGKITKTIVHETTGWVITKPALEAYRASISLSHQERGKKTDIG